MISFKNRFHGLNALRFVYANGKTVRSSTIGMKVALNNRRDNFRVAVVVSKKISKSAVKRNRMRRRVYEVIRSHELAITQPYDIAITVYSDSVIDMPAAQLNDQVTKLLKEAGVIS